MLEHVRGRRAPAPAVGDGRQLGEVAEAQDAYALEPQHLQGGNEIQGDEADLVHEDNVAREGAAHDVAHHKTVRRFAALTQVARTDV
eukprot:4087007-Alexandrium_andersonii.AAC.1